MSDEDFDPLEVDDDDSQKEWFWKKTNDKSAEYQRFDEYFRAVDKYKDEGQQLDATKGYVFRYITAKENEVLYIPPRALVVAAYWGCPKNAAKGKLVTRQVLSIIRDKPLGAKRGILASLEIFGDPWYVYMPVSCSFMSRSMHHRSHHHDTIFPSGMARGNIFN